VSPCVCNRLGVYLDGAEDTLYVVPCERHPLPVGDGQCADRVAGARVDACLDAIAAIRDVLWPRGDTAAEWSSETLDDVERAMGFLRPPECAHLTVVDDFCRGCGSAVLR
jgi:hypothetical protein